jgi:hypothetical protein
MSAVRAAIIEDSHDACSCGDEDRHDDEAHDGQNRVVDLLSGAATIADTGVALQELAAGRHRRLEPRHELPVHPGPIAPDARSSGVAAASGVALAAASAIPSASRWYGRGGT